MKDLLVVCFIMLWCSYYWFWFWFCGDLGLWIFVGLLVQWYLVLTEVVVVAVAVAVGEKNSGHSSPPWWLLFHVRGHVMMVVFLFSDTFSSRRMRLAFCFGETTTNAAPGHTHNRWVVMVSWHIIGMVVVSLKRKTSVLLVRRVVLLF